MDNEIVRHTSSAHTASAHTGGPGLFSLAHKKWQAWLTEEATDAELRMLDCQRRVIEGRRTVAEAELDARIALDRKELGGRLDRAETEREALIQNLEGRRRVAELTLLVEETEAERILLQTVRQAPPAQARQIVGAALETERLLAERDRLRRERLGSSARAAFPATDSVSALPAPVFQALTSSAITSSAVTSSALEVHVSDHQIETLAVRALTRFAGLSPDEADQRWEEWKRELYVRLPPYAAAEVERRADELRGLSE